MSLVTSKVTSKDGNHVMDLFSLFHLLAYFLHMIIMDPLNLCIFLLRLRTDNPFFLSFFFSPSKVMDTLLCCLCFHCSSLLLSLLCKYIMRAYPFSCFIYLQFCEVRKTNLLVSYCLSAGVRLHFM